VGFFTNWRRDLPAQFAGNAAWTLKTRHFFIWHAPCIDIGTGPVVGSAKKMKRGFQMFTLASARETATVIAGAFISALLLVSAATSLPIA
jgi:hypothetical protein